MQQLNKKVTSSFQGGTPDFTDNLEMIDFSAFNGGLDDSVMGVFPTEKRSNLVDFVPQAQIDAEVETEMKAIWLEKVKPYAKVNEPEQIYEQWVKTSDGKKLKKEVTQAVKDRHAGVTTGGTMSKVGDWLESDRGQNTINTILGGIGAFFGGKNRGADTTGTTPNAYNPNGYIPTKESISPVTIGIIAVLGIGAIGTIVYFATKKKAVAPPVA